jgi:hypothetical protein
VSGPSSNSTTQAPPGGRSNSLKRRLHRVHRPNRQRHAVRRSLGVVVERDSVAWFGIRSSVFNDARWRGRAARSRPRAMGRSGVRNLPVPERVDGRSPEADMGATGPKRSRTRRGGTIPAGRRRLAAFGAVCAACLRLDAPSSLLHDPWHDERYAVPLGAPLGADLEGQGNSWDRGVRCWGRSGAVARSLSMGYWPDAPVHRLASIACRWL